MSVLPGSPALCQVLREDPELAEAIPPERRSQAIRDCTAREIVVASAEDEARMPEGGIGLLMLEGLLVRRVGIDERFGAELLGEGDLLRPWQDGRDVEMLPLQTGWSVVEPAHMAVLDRDFVHLHSLKVTGCCPGIPVCARLAGEWDFRDFSRLLPATENR